MYSFLFCMHAFNFSMYTHGFMRNKLSVSDNCSEVKYSSINETSVTKIAY